jgi:hypothetical protein
MNSAEAIAAEIDKTGAILEAVKMQAQRCAQRSAPSGANQVPDFDFQACRDLLSA